MSVSMVVIVVVVVPLSVVNVLKIIQGQWHIHETSLRRKVKSVVRILH